MRFNRILILSLILMSLGACRSASPPLAMPTANEIPNSATESPSSAVAILPPENEVPISPVPETTGPTSKAVVDVIRQRYAKAIEALKTGQTNHAIHELIAVSQQAPAKPFVFTNLGLAYLAQGNFNLAEQSMRRAIAENPEDAIAFNHLGVLQRKKGAFSDALKDYQRALEINQSYASAHLNLGILFDLYLQNMNKALIEYQQFQTLTNNTDKRVANWITDLKRRIESAARQQRS